MLKATNTMFSRHEERSAPTTSSPEHYVLVLDLVVGNRTAVLRYAEAEVVGPHTSCMVSTRRKRKDSRKMCRATLLATVWPKGSFGSWVLKQRCYLNLIYTQLSSSWSCSTGRVSMVASSLTGRYNLSRPKKQD